MNKQKILLLTLVHPDYLPPVYATAQVLRDQGFDIHILTFESSVAEKYDPGENIVLETCGKHSNVGMLQRLKLRRAFKKRARQIVSEQPTAIITFCPFSFQCGLKIKKNNIPVIYIALEIADFNWPLFLGSPISNLRNLRVIKTVHKADLLATVSIQRSAWLAGRAHLDFMPQTIHNTVYLTDKKRTETSLMPPEYAGKKIILYTGAVGSDQCIIEVVRAFDMIEDEDSALIIAGLKDNNYCKELREHVAQSKSTSRIKLFPFLSRNEVFALQSHSHIGVCLFREAYEHVNSKMIAPNKAGEYLSNNLYILGISTDYLKHFEIRGFASLATSPTPRDISTALRSALKTVEGNEYKGRIEAYVQEEFCMQQQLKPVIAFLSES